MYQDCNDIRYVVINHNIGIGLGVIEWLKYKPPDRRYPKTKGYIVEEIFDNERGNELKNEILDIIHSIT